MIQESLILRMCNDDIKTVIEFLSSLQLVLVLGLAVAKDVEVLPERVDLVHGVRGQGRPLHVERYTLDGHFVILFHFSLFFTVNL